MGRPPARLLRTALLAALLSACAGSPAATSVVTLPTAMPEGPQVVSTTTAPDFTSEAGQIVPAGVLAVPRAAHTATRLRDGRVLIAGGCTRPGCGGNDDALRSELFDPATGAFSEGGAMTVPRAGHTATLLADGRVLLVGGYEGEGRPPLDSAEIYDPATGRFVTVGALAGPRGAHTATALPDGRVLVAGGTDGDAVVDLAEIFDPTTGRFTFAAPLPGPRAAHAAVRVGAGVLVIGGHTVDAEVVLATSVRYDPATDTWTDAGDLQSARHKLAAAALPDGSALAIGGSGPTDDRSRLASIERWDPSAAAWTTVAEMSVARFKIENAVAVLNDGRVFIAGDGTVAEMYDPGNHSLDTVPGLDASAMFSTATTLVDGRVLVTGGYDDAITPQAAAYLYEGPG